MIPPIALPGLKAIQNKLRYWSTGVSHENEYLPLGWDSLMGSKASSGWDVGDWVEHNKRMWLRLKAICEGTGPMVPHQEDLRTIDGLTDHNRIMIFAYSLALAFGGFSSLSILDWGGALGQSYFVAKALLPDNVEIDYHCKETRSLVEWGRQLMPDQHFHDDESCLERRYGMVMAHASFYYTRYWESLMEGLAKATAKYLLITRQPFVLDVPSYVCLERLYRFGYQVEAPAWVFNRASFLREAEKHDLKLVREFVTGQTYEVEKAPEQPLFLGFLFKSASVK
jgi:putative methyltransferase (TIGR04325 family)